MTNDDRTLHQLAAADAALPPPPAHRLTAADLARALRRQNLRRGAVAIAALLLVGLGWLQLRATPQAATITARELAAMQRELTALQQQLRQLLEPDCATATAALRARTRATLAVADAERLRRATADRGDHR